MTSDKRQQQRHQETKKYSRDKKKTRDTKKTQDTKKQETNRDTRDNKDTGDITNSISSLGKPSKNEIQQQQNNKKVFECV